MTNTNINYLTEAEHRKEAEFTKLLEELDELKKENRRLEKELYESREPYDYREAVKNDVLDALEDYDFKDYETLEDLEEVLNHDRVTIWIYLQTRRRNLAAIWASGSNAAQNIVMFLYVVTYWAARSLKH
ncbi:MAG: hypothetical protein KH231_06045 [Dialister sp.]|uniref:hypothetical protein n=1 Tax=Dialister sp. TaxID=1955814 RepID=UPI001D7F5F47|nr:hypothetical protein [Dialister sp.]MBS6715018.1 hypothetical protein [Dialister sp.]